MVTLHEALELLQQNTADNKQLLLLVSTMHFMLPFCIEPCSVELLGLTVLARCFSVAEFGCDADLGIFSCKTRLR